MFATTVIHNSCSTSTVILRNAIQKLVEDVIHLCILYYGALDSGEWLELKYVLLEFFHSRRIKVHFICLLSPICCPRHLHSRSVDVQLAQSISTTSIQLRRHVLSLFNCMRTQHKSRNVCILRISYICSHVLRYADHFVAYIHVYHYQLNDRSAYSYSIVYRIMMLH
jgi:hypothetical protein